MGTYVTTCQGGGKSANQVKCAFIMAAGIGKRMKPVSLETPNPLVKVNGARMIDAMYDYEEASRFIREYLRDDFTEVKFYHYLAYTALIAYYWFVWALYRESCGAVMGEALDKWRSMAETAAQWCENLLFLEIQK